MYVRGGTVSNTEQSCVKTPGCTMYRSLYGSVWFGLVAYKMIEFSRMCCNKRVRNLFLRIDDPVNKVQYGAVIKQLSRL